MAFNIMHKNRPVVLIQGSYLPALLFATLFLLFSYITFDTYDDNWLISEKLATIIFTTFFGVGTAIFVIRAWRPLLCLNFGGIHHRAFGLIRWSDINQSINQNCWFNLFSYCSYIHNS
jgi:glucan phosphoethanolaminetransferase (alkaline phosphatase superfamily)